MIFRSDVAKVNSPQERFKIDFKKFRDDPKSFKFKREEQNLNESFGEDESKESSDKKIDKKDTSGKANKNFKEDKKPENIMKDKKVEYKKSILDSSDHNIIKETKTNSRKSPLRCAKSNLDKEAVNLFLNDPKSKYVPKSAKILNSNESISKSSSDSGEDSIMIAENKKISKIYLKKVKKIKQETKNKNLTRSQSKKPSITEKLRVSNFNQINFNLKNFINQTRVKNPVNTSNIQNLKEDKLLINENEASVLNGQANNNKDLLIAGLLSRINNLVSMREDLDE